MSQNKELRERWCLTTLTAAVVMFHKARKHPDNEVESLETIALRCANTAFQDMADLIPGDKEVAAKRYGQMAYERFTQEIYEIVTAPEEKEELAA